MHLPPVVILRRRGVWRMLAWTALILAGLEGVYLAGANWWLRSGRPEALASRRPDRVRIVWTDAQTWFPGHLRVRDLDLQVQTRAVQWSATAAEASGLVALPGLLTRRLRIASLRARGVTVWARRAPPEGPPTERERLAAPFPAFEGPPAPPQQPVDPRREPWVFDLPDMDLRDVREVWVNELHWTGLAHGQVDLLVQGGRKVRLGPSWAEIDPDPAHPVPSTVTIRPDLRVEQLAGRIDASIDAFDPRADRGWAILQHTVATLRASGATPAGAVVDFYMRPTTPWLQLTGGDGPLHADLRLRRGSWLEGSRVEGSSPDLSARLLGVMVEGNGRWAWQVGGEESAAVGLTLSFDSYRVRQPGQEAPMLEGTGLEVESAPAEVVGAAAFRRFTPRRAVLGQARVPDLRRLNSYVPAASGVKIQAGSANLTGEAAQVPGKGPGVLAGTLRLETAGARAEALGNVLTGDATVDVALPAVLWEEQEFSLAGSRLELRNVRLRGPSQPASAGWWARFHVDEGWMRPGRQPYFQARGTGRLRNSTPIVALAMERRPVPEWFQRLLEVDDVSTSGAVSLFSGEVRLRDVRAEGEEIELRGEFRRRDGADPAGLFYARWRALAVGMRLDGGDRDYKLRRPLEWFEAEKAALRNGS